MIASQLRNANELEGQGNTGLSHSISIRFPNHSGVNSWLNLTSSFLSPETAVMGPFLFSDTVVQQGQVSANVTTGLEMNVSGKATVFHGSSLQFQAVTIPPHNWKDLQKR